MTAAEVRLAGQSGVFIAEACRIDGLAVHAQGRWRHRVGANYAEVRYGDRRAYTWPLSRVAEIRWIEATA